jgi:hypothetical protein
MKSRNCNKCNQAINPLRLQILPNTNCCVKCSDVSKVAGHVIISGKNTYSEIQIVDQETSIRLGKLGYRRGQSVSAGVRFKFDPKFNK